jgi:tetratricopeptide (TPR) repeat protein
VSPYRVPRHHVKVQAIKKRLRELIKSDPDFLDSHDYLGWLLREEGSFAEERKLRVEAYERALKQMSDSKGRWPDVMSWLYLENRHIIRALFNRAMLYWSEHENKNAADLLRKLLRSNPSDNVGARYCLLGVVAGMTFEEYELRFEREDQSATVVNDWFDLNSKKFPDEFAWWEEAVEPMTRLDFDRLTQPRDDSKWMLRLQEETERKDGVSSGATTTPAPTEGQEHPSEDSHQAPNRGDGQATFPRAETYRAADGRQVKFQIRARVLPSGYVLTAEETHGSRGAGFGYRFTAYSAVKPWIALAALLQKIRRTLAVKYLEASGGHILLTHDELMGRIDYSTEDEEVVLEVDGQKLTKEEFWRIISTYEGFEIELKIRDS